jgi:H+-translocating NAD(P) transhydrogenase subunit alpha
LLHHLRDGKFQLDFADDITDNTCIAHAGEIRNGRVLEALKNLHSVVVS